MDVVAAVLGNMDARKARPHRAIGQGFLVGLVRPRVEYRAPATLEIVARDLEEVGPLLRIRHVAAQAAAERGREIELRGDHEEALRPRIALELDAEAFAHRAAT